MKNCRQWRKIYLESRKITLFWLSWVLFFLRVLLFSIIVEILICRKEILFVTWFTVILKIENFLFTTISWNSSYDFIKLWTLKIFRVLSFDPKVQYNSEKRSYSRCKGEISLFETVMDLVTNKIYILVKFYIFYKRILFHLLRGERTNSG